MMRASNRATFLRFAACVTLAACAADEAPPPPEISATNAFYYYADVDAAWAFYRDTLGFETVVDYGFAKILRMARDSYITVVAAESGMHSTDEPKTVTLTLVTEQLPGWYERLKAAGVSIRSDIDGPPESSFDIADPEGYAIRFQRADVHAAVPAIASLSSLHVSDGERPLELGVVASIFSIYFEDLGTIRPFYEGLIGVQKARGDTPLYQVAGSGFIELIEGGDELHRPTEENGVTLSFFTDHVDAWHARAAGWPGLTLRHETVVGESGLVRVFVAYDPGGYFLEWDTFLDREENTRLLELLGRGDGP